MILEIIAIIIVFIVILLFLFLLIGMKVNINLSKKDSNFEGLVEIKWIFIKIFSKNFHEHDDIEENNEKRENQFKDLKSLIQLIQKNFDDILDLLLTCIDSISLEKLYTNISLGFSSPVDTVNVVGHIWAFSSVFNLRKDFYLSAQPVFTKETIDFDSEICFKIHLLRPVVKLLNLLTKKSIIIFILESRKGVNND